MENQPKTHMLSPLEVRSEPILFKQMGTFVVGPGPGIQWSWFCVDVVWEIPFPLLQRKSNYFPTELTWRSLWNASERHFTVNLFHSPSIKNHLKFYSSGTLTLILVHILQSEKEARSKFWEVSSIKNCILESLLSQDEATTGAKGTGLSGHSGGAGSTFFPWYLGFLH